jgi:hypothetical protein
LNIQLNIQYCKNNKRLYLTNYEALTVPVIKDLEYIIIDKTVTRNIKGAYYKEDIIFDEDDIQPHIVLMKRYQL